MKARILRFPDDLAAGEVRIFRGADLVRHARASGEVAVPAGCRVSLWLSVPVRGLAMLRPDDVQAIRMEKRRPTGDDLARISHLTGLQALCCSKCSDVTDHGLAALAGLYNLRALDLYETEVSDAGLLHLAGMVQLEDLHLGATRVQGPGLRLLGALQRLRRLDLHDTDVDDAAIPSLVRLSALRTIGLSATRLTASGLARLRAAFPAGGISMRDPGRRLARERGRFAAETNGALAH